MSRSFFGQGTGQSPSPDAKRTPTAANQQSSGFFKGHVSQVDLSIVLENESAIQVIKDNIDNINTVGGAETAINTVANKITDVSSVSTNMVELLEVDDNAAIATTKAAEASVSASSAQASQDAVEDIIPTGGDAEMILVKSSNVTHDLKWTNTLDNTTIDASMNGGYF